MNKIGHLLKVSKLTTSRLHTSARCFDGKNILPKSTPEASPKSAPNLDIGKDFLAPSSLDKFILIWAKKYKSRDEIPNLVPGATYNHARNIARIKLANYTIVLVIIGCIFSVYLGKREAKRGNTLQKRSLDWHEELKREHEREMQEKAALASGKP